MIRSFIHQVPMLITLLVVATSTIAGVHDPRAIDNGFSLFGLKQALEAQGNSAVAEEVTRRINKARAAADVKLTSSRF